MIRACRPITSATAPVTSGHPSHADTGRALSAPSRTSYAHHAGPRRPGRPAALLGGRAIATVDVPRRSSRRPLPRDAGSGGGATTRYLTFGSADRPLVLERGGALGPVALAYETYGELAPDGGNAILACHALSGDAHAAGWSLDPSAPSAVDGMGADEKGIV